jgi:hypothetical protein
MLLDNFSRRSTMASCVEDTRDEHVCLANQLHRFHGGGVSEFEFQAAFAMNAVFKKNAAPTAGGLETAT